MPQLLLFPDPRPLVERLGAPFFRDAPQRPGVYLMRDSGDNILYVGKAKNLRKRLVSYRVANPDRLRRRHLRLLRAVSRIELEECADEACALAREAELLRALRPRFNRAGTWPGLPRVLNWRADEVGLHLVVNSEALPDWRSSGPLGGRAAPLRAALLRLLWCAIHSADGMSTLPQGWFVGRHGQTATITRTGMKSAVLAESALRLADLFADRGNEFLEWLRARTSTQNLPFQIAARDADLETLSRLLGMEFSL
jgi:predicted GIY-YIG superfamily endonuclease